MEPLPVYRPVRRSESKASYVSKRTLYFMCLQSVFDVSMLRVGQNDNVMSSHGGLKIFMARGEMETYLLVVAQCPLQQHCLHP